jgi:hypothetical protein
MLRKLLPGHVNYLKYQYDHRRQPSDDIRLRSTHTAVNRKLLARKLYEHSCAPLSYAAMHIGISVDAFVENFVVSLMKYGTAKHVQF